MTVEHTAGRRPDSGPAAGQSETQDGTAMSEEREVPYIVVEKGGSAIGAFFWGLVVGAATALLFAPKSGQETQEELRESARKLKEEAGTHLADLRKNVEEGLEKTKTSVADRVETVREEAREKKRQTAEALRAGKEAAQQARGDLEKRVAESKAAYKAALGSDDQEEASPEASAS